MAVKKVTVKNLDTSPVSIGGIVIQPNGSAEVAMSKVGLSMIKSKSIKVMDKKAVAEAEAKKLAEVEAEAEAEEEVEAEAEEEVEKKVATKKKTASKKDK